MSDLTPKQARFIEEYLIDLNATAAAKRAGYSERTAYAQGQRLLKNVEIAVAIQKAQEARSERTRIDQDWVIERLVGVYEASMEARPVCDKNGEEKGFTFNPTAANRALELIGKHKGMFIDRKLIGLRRIEDMTEDELVALLGDDRFEGDDSLAGAEPAGNA